MEACKNRGLQLVVGCDANAHHIIWGSTDINRRGTSLLEYLSTTELEILNRGSKPTFVTTRRQEVIDITMGSKKVAQAIKDWQVAEEVTLSDHRLIEFKLAGDANHEPTGVYRNPRATDWQLYKEGLGRRLGGDCGRPKTGGGVEQAAEELQLAITQTYETSCPAKQRKSSKRVPWWNQELSRHRTRARKLLNRAMRRNTRIEWENYREAHRSYKKLIRASKRKTWREFCQEAEALPLVARLRKVFASGPSEKLNGLRLPDGRYLEDRQQILEHLIEVHFPGSRLFQQGQPTEELEPEKEGPKDWGMASRVVNRDRIRWAINSFKRFKSPGVDGIFPALLQEGGEDLIKRLDLIFKSCLALGNIPKTWRTARVVFIPKPGKKDYDSAKSFRPICLTSFLLKTLERLVDRHIREYALVERPVQISQHTYQAGRSVETALHHLVGVVEGALERKRSVLSVFLDIEGAFDNTSLDAISRALDSFKVEDSIRRWIRNMLRTRAVMASWEGTTIRARADRGCPQGGVLSPLLWTLVVDELLRGLGEEGVIVQGYADDIVIAVRGTSPTYMARRMQKALTLVQKWCQNQNLKVNPCKTEMVLFARKRNLKFKAPSIFGAELHTSSEVKYLGVTLDKKLTWKSHVAKQTQKALVTYWACRRMFGSTWGLKPWVVKWIYTAILEPQLIYASVVWWTSTRRDIHRRTLSKVYRLALLGITGVLWRWGSCWTWRHRTWLRRPGLGRLP